MCIVFCKFLPKIKSYPLAEVTNKSTFISNAFPIVSGAYITPTTPTSLPFAIAIVRLDFCINLFNLFAFSQLYDINDTLAPVSISPYMSVPYTLQGK